MSQGFKLRYDQLRDNDPTKSEAAAKPSDKHDFYDSPGHARSLCLAWPDGKRMFLSYAYLVSGEFTPHTEKNVIILRFSSHTVTLKGYGLEPLFMALMDHLPRLIVATDPRYVLTDDMKEVLVIDMVMETKAD